MSTEVNNTYETKKEDVQIKKQKRSIFKRKEKKKPCYIYEVHKCKLNGDYKNCGFNRKECPSRKGKKDNILSKLKNNIGFVFIFISLIGLFVCSLKNNLPKDAPFNSSVFWSFFKDVFSTILAGAIFAYAIDLFVKYKDLENFLIRSLTSNSHLKKLDNEKLRKLRIDVTNELHTKSIANVANGLIDLDQNICDLISEPYYERYRHFIVCRTSLDENGASYSPLNEISEYIWKENTIEYTIINPYGSNKPIKEIIRNRPHILFKNIDTDKPKDYIKDFSIEYIVDDNDNDKKTFNDEKIDWSMEKNNSYSEFYNVKLKLKKINNIENTNNETKKENNTEEDGFEVMFSKNLKVKQHYFVKVPKEDICFTKRIQHTALSFIISYSHHFTDQKLHGQMFGSNIKQDSITTNIERYNITLESNNIMLPQNGAIIVMTPMGISNSANKNS
jgi:hypothetical protein